MAAACRFAWLSITAVVLAATIAHAAAVDHRSARPDGSPIYWTLDRQGGGPKQGILVLGQGSGCQAATENRRIAGFKNLLPDFAVLTVEKWGVTPHDAPKDPYEGCAPDFYLHHSVAQRAVDYQRVLRDLEAEPWWDGRLVLFGGSEGSATMAVLAPRVKPTAVVLFSTAPVRDLAASFKRSMPPPAAVEADATFAAIRADPASPKVWGGSSYVWWADILKLDLTADALAIRAPILMVQGDRDTNAPVEDARTVRDAFRAAGHCNLTYWELAGYDHLMNDAAGLSHLDEVARRISAWLRGKLNAPTSEIGCWPTDAANAIPAKRRLHKEADDSEQTCPILFSPTLNSRPCTTG